MIKVYLFRNENNAGYKFNEFVSEVINARNANEGKNARITNALPAAETGC